MRIALYHNLPSGGAKRAVYEWIQRMAGRHSIDVFSLSTADHGFCDIRPFVSQYKIYEFFPRDLFKSPFGRLNQFRRWQDLGDLDKLNRRIAMHINAGRYDVLFAHTCMFSFIPAVLAHTEIPSVYYLHEPFGRGFVRDFDRPYLSKTKWRESVNRFDPFIWLYKYRLGLLQAGSVTKTGLFLSNSQFTRKHIRAEYRVDAPNSPYGVSVNGFQPVEGLSRGDYVVSVGEMSPRKGFDFVVESLAEIPMHQRPALKLACNTINSDELNYIKSIAERSDVDLEVLSHLGVKELRHLYSKARLCVYAPVMEPFGLVPLEAMACGTPVVGVREGGVPESIIHEHTGLLVERDAKNFGAAIKFMLENPSLAETYGRNGRDHVRQHWTWERSVSVLESHLEACISNHTGQEKLILEENGL